MEDDTFQENNLWSNLPTITSFDKGGSSLSTKCIDESIKSKNSKNKKIVKKISSSNNSLLIVSLVKFLSTAFEKDAAKREKLYSLLCSAMHKNKLIDISCNIDRFELINEEYADAVYRLIKTARKIIGSDNSIPIPRPFVTYVSPYQDQFQETGFIAGGGFGNVFKAVHKLDEVEYAIKKIIVRPGRMETIMSHLEEVKTFAKLNHTNIVSYKQAWIEPISTLCMPQLPFKSDSDGSDSSNSLNESKLSCKEFNESQGKHKNLNCVTSINTKSHRLFIQSSNYRNQIFKNSSLQRHESNSDIVSFREDDEMCSASIKGDSSQHIVEINSRTSTEESLSSNESLEDHRICQYSTQTNQYAMLYIQMALCDKTLRQWLTERIEPTPITMIAAIATQILYGINYIHSLKIVHHDIKPSNIFISMSGKLQVQLGDFGLACPLQRDSHDAIVGTCMYAAPEQLKGECNPKSDIYSLGVVLLELLIPMSTTMECMKIIEILKAGEIPPQLATSHPKWATRISQLLQKNPVKRPSSDELLEELKIDKDLTIAKLQDENQKLQNENSILQTENKNKDEIIEDQKIKIEQLKAMLAKLKACDQLS